MFIDWATKFCFFAVEAWIFNIHWTNIQCIQYKLIYIFGRESLIVQEKRSRNYVCRVLNYWSIYYEGNNRRKGCEARKRREIQRGDYPACLWLLSPLRLTVQSHRGISRQAGSWYGTSFSLCRPKSKNFHWIITNHMFQ